MVDSKEINYRKSSVPSSPGAQQITVNGCDSMKGGAPFVSKMPKENLIPGDVKSSDKNGK